MNVIWEIISRMRPVKTLVIAKDFHCQGTSYKYPQHLMLWNKNQSPQYCIPSFKVFGLLSSEKKIFKGFSPYLGMENILSSDPNPKNKPLFPHPTGAPHVIWFQSAQQF